MQKTLSVNGKKFTAKQIVSEKVGVTNGEDFISILNGVRVIWNYRHNDNDNYFNPVCNESEANNIQVVLWRDTGDEKIVLVTYP